MFASVLICTHNRSALLSEALESLAQTRTTLPWELVLVDNGSRDNTRSIVAQQAASFPVPLRYVSEPRLGKSIALNTGMGHAAGRVMVFGDDDQRFAEDWVERGCAPLIANPDIDYTGGPVLPLAAPILPPWLDLDHSEYRAPLGVVDYGTEPFVFEERKRIAGGGNMAVRRTLLDRIGGFCERLGRRGRSLLGQEQAEFFSRSRAVGARGAFVPDMRVWHHVPPERLHRRYFVRWWYWKGIGHARWHAMAGWTEYGLEMSTVPRVGGVPRFVFGEGARALVRAVAQQLGRSGAPEQFLPVLRLAYLTGYAAEAGLRPRTPLRVQSDEILPRELI